MDEQEDLKKGLEELKKPKEKKPKIYEQFHKGNMRMGRLRDPDDGHIVEEWEICDESRLFPFKSFKK